MLILLSALALGKSWLPAELAAAIGGYLHLQGLCCRCPSVEARSRNGTLSLGLEALLSLLSVSSSSSSSSTSVHLLLNITVGLQLGIRLLGDTVAEQRSRTVSGEVGSFSLPDLRILGFLFWTRQKRQTSRKTDQTYNGTVIQLTTLTQFLLKP